jgi:MurNAc alpha-1-phosphate uridylyltransferase
MQAVILAGGLATRMRPRTLTTPKFLLEVSGRPFAAWLLERLARAGYTDVLLCIAHLGETIRDFVGDGASFGLRVAYADEGPRLLGTAGALRRALDQLEPTFLVTYGDSYLPFDYAAPLRAMNAATDADGVMAVYDNEGRWDASNTAVRWDANGELWVSRYEKGSTDPTLRYIDYGAMALHRTIIARLPPDTPSGLDAIQHELARTGRLRAHLARERFFEIGSETGLLDFEKVIADHGGHP